MKALLNRLQQLSKPQLIALHLLKEQQRGAVAVVGIGCRFPGGADDPDHYWELIRQRRSTLGLVPEDRWPMARFYDPDNHGDRFNIRHGSFLDDVRHFDAAFFNLGEAEARALDPQHRLLLECGWHAIEDAAIAPSRLRGSNTGVYVGLMNNEYHQCWNMQDIGPFHGGGISNSTASGRLSYLLDLQGPSMTLDTACSSSLVALHLACQSLINKECDVALAGGVNVMLSPYTYLLLARAFMLSPSGQCHTFDQCADGYARGEGCGMMLLKRLDDAVRDGDPIRAVIAGSASNQDGRSQGFSAPSGVAQQKVIQTALKNAGKKPEQIQFVECHGTGTPLGDPIELNALQAIYGKQRTSPLWLGAVKNNIGHTESAAGVAGMIKLVLALEHAELPPQHCFDTPNPYFQWQQSALQVNQALAPWPQPVQGERVGAVSSFGIAGTNAHVIVQQAPSTIDLPNNVSRAWHVFALSAGDAQALQALAECYRDWLDSHTPALGDLCHTLTVGRDHCVHRLAIVCDSLDTLRQRLRAECTALQRAPKSGATPLYNAVPQPEVTFTMPFTASVIPSEKAIASMQTLSPVFADAWQEVSASDAAPVFAWEYALGKMWMSWYGASHPQALNQAADCIADAVVGNLTVADALQRYRLVSVALTPAVSTAQPKVVNAESAPSPVITLPMAVALNDADNPMATLFHTVASLYRLGETLQWAEIDKPLSARRLHLPVYRFTRQYYWLEEAVWDHPAPQQLLPLTQSVPETAPAQLTHWHNAAVAAFGASATHALLSGKTYIDLGIDSLSLMNFRKELEQRSGKALSLTDLMNIDWTHLTTTTRVPPSAPDVPQPLPPQNTSAPGIVWRQWGDAQQPVLLCLHGLFDTSLAWESLAPLLTAQGWRVVAPDLPGHGDSLRLSQYRPDEMVLSLLQWLEADAIQPQALLAHSFGSIIATLLSQNVAGFKGPLFYLDPVWPFAERLNPRQQIAVLTQPISPHRRFESPVQAVQLMQSITPHLPAALLETLTLANLQPVDTQWAWKWDACLKTLLSAGFYLTRQHYREWIASLSSPLHVMCAERDDTVTLADRQAWREQTGVRSWRAMPAGHHLHLALPIDVCDWLNRLAHPRSAMESNV